ncbi:MAG: hypothetical protein IJ678_00090 [Kiritimatiellae bacterium]|nr:hypothetical protein [Kiritimatiellia bacterium]MBR1835977.1 hypothetical protein [Kiritimatiellia bacterium]
MSSNNITHHGEASNVIWGAGDKFSAYGFLQSLNTQGDGSVSELKNEDGQIVGLTVYDKKNTLTAEITMKASTTPPEFGEIVTIDQKKYICRGVTKTAENENYVKLSLTLESYENVTLS